MEIIGSTSNILTRYIHENVYKKTFLQSTQEHSNADESIEYRLRNGIYVHTISHKQNYNSTL